MIGVTSDQVTVGEHIFDGTLEPAPEGLVARVGDLVLDGSVRTQLATLRSRLLN